MEDYASAASRHWDNAQFLADADRWQEAAYLAGYVAECSLKALLKCTAPKIQLQTLGHDLIALTGEALEMAVLLNPASRRYPVSNLSTGSLGVGRWRPQHRYQRTGFLSQRELRQMVTDAGQIGQAVLIPLILDGTMEDIPS